MVNPITNANVEPQKNANGLEEYSGGPIRKLSQDGDGLTEKVIGAAIEVHRALGPGYGESLYEEALSIELTSRGIRFIRQHVVRVTYKTLTIGETRLDFLVHPDLIVELKSVEKLAPVHTAQVIAYLKATGFARALLLNFNVAILKDGLKRITRPNQTIVP